jgi:23S rRNA (adenine2030-N6)-methyltransferase
VKYRHRFHAGNFADVHKHVTLVALLRALQRKDKGLFYFETHAGRGWYAGDGDSQPGTEIRDGYALLAARQPASDAIRDFLATESAARDVFARGSTPPRADSAYAGSPLLAAALLRAQDRGVCCEWLPPECRALQQALLPWPGMRALCADGPQSLRSQFPPRERRALLLIDPPYEDPATELDAALAITVEALTRLAGTVVALWYPIKDDRLLAPWLRRCAARLTVATLQCELWRHPRDSRVALNGSGLLIVNAPWQLDTQMQQWLPELGTLLGVDAQGGTAMRWLVQENSPES